MRRGRYLFKARWWEPSLGLYESATVRADSYQAAAADLSKQWKIDMQVEVYRSRRWVTVNGVPAQLDLYK